MATVPPNKTVIIIDHNDSFAQFESHVSFTRNNDPHPVANSVAKYFERLASGTQPAPASVSYYEGAVPASGVLTFSGQPSNGQTLTVAGTTFTATSLTNATTPNFSIGSTFPITVANLVTSVNQSPSCNASALLLSSGVVGFYSEMPGSLGNNLTLSTSLSNTTLLSGNFTGAQNGTYYNFQYGR